MICQVTSSRVRAPGFVTSELYRRPAYGRNHPLAIPRVEIAVDLCRIFGWLDGGLRESQAASFAQLTAFHDADYVAALREADAFGHVSDQTRRRYNIGTLENPVFPGVFMRAATAVGGSILAARYAAEGGIAYHPAGGTHHAKRGRAGGFCYFNDPVFAILTLLDHGLTRILYADLDAHHGDGVEDVFASDPRVFTISIHEAGRWPGTGESDDRREGRARNLAVPEGLNDSEFAVLIEDAVLPLAARFGPEAVVITAGADSLAGDPLSRMMLSNGAVWDAVARIADSAPAAVVLGGGGYTPWTVGRFWAGLWGVLAGKPLPERLPEEAHALLASLSCDLVDDEDVDPQWLTALADRPNPGPVRDAISVLAEKALAP
jgi:acetoin utilization protein AcuC